MFSKLFRKTNSRLDKIVTEANVHKKNVEQIVEKIKIGQNFQSKYIDVLMSICKYFDFLIYQKDENNLYEFSNVAHCVNFFKLEPECVNGISGMDDLEIMNGYKERTGKEHTFYQVCKISDKIIKKSSEPKIFIFGGQIGNEELICYVKKIPLIENEKFVGSIGISKLAKFNKMALKKIDKLDTISLYQKDKYNFLLQCDDETQVKFLLG